MVLYIREGIMNESNYIESLQSALKSLRVVRNSFGNFLKSLTESPKLEGDEEIESSGQKLFLTFRMDLRELEKNITNLSPVNHSGGASSDLTNLDILSLDPIPDKLPLYHQLLDSYTWINKATFYSGIVHSLCSGNHLKRSSLPSKRKRSLPMQYDANLSPQTVDAHIHCIKGLFPDMSINTTRSFGTNVILQITLGRLLKAIVVLRGLVIESVIVRSFSESQTDENGKLDLFKPSEHKVFQKVSDNANAAMLHFFTPGLVDLSIRSFFTWLNSYSNLFTEACKKCGYHMRHNFPPTWREFRTLQPYHEDCRP